MNKLYDRIDFVNNTVPALNETNLDLMSKAIDDIDDRVIEIAGDVLVVVPEILDKYADIEALATNPPYIGQNGHWWTWDTDLNQYVDSGVDAGVSVTVGTTTTLPAGSSATVTNSGTDTDPILNFGIPQGATGQNGQDGTDGQDGVSPEVTITQITGGHTVTITDKDHPSGQSFNVMDGQSGGSGGHTIINSSGTSMTQRDGLQFSGLNVTDDSANDKTVVTLPTPDYVDEQFNPSTTYSKGMTCIEGNIRYRYKNSTATSGHRPPDTTYWEVYSVAEEIKKSTEFVEIAGNRGTTTYNNSRQTLGSTQLSSSITFDYLRNNYKELMLVYFTNSTAQATEEGYIPIASNIIPLNYYNNHSISNNAYFDLFAYDNVATAHAYVILQFMSPTGQIQVSAGIFNDTQTTYKIGWKLYAR